MATRNPKTGLFPVEEVDTRGLSFLPEDPKKKVSISTAGPIELGANLFKPETFSESIPKGLISGTSSPIRGLMDYFTDVLPRTKPQNLGMVGMGASLTGLDPLRGDSPDPLKTFKDFLRGVEDSNNYTKANYEGESLASLIGKLAKSGTVEDLQRFTDYTANHVAQQIPQQLALWGSAAAGIPAPVALSAIGMSQAGSKYSEDKENSPNLTEDQRVNRANISGVSSGATEGLGYGLSKLALAGKTVFDAIPKEAMPAISKTLGKGVSKLFSDLARTVGADPAKRVMFNVLMDTFGEGAEEVVDTAVNIASDEHYKTKMYSAQEMLDAMIESFGIAAISSGIVGAPMMAASELQEGREKGVLPSPEQLFVTKRIIQVLKNGLEGSQNPENQPHVVDGDWIILESQVDSMIQNQEWNDPEGQGTLEAVGKHLKNTLYDERGFVRMAGGHSYLEEVINSKVPNRASPEQILKTLEGAGVPKEEVDDMGLFEWLKGKDKVTKQELQDYLSGNDIQIQEVKKGTNEHAKQEAYDEYNRFVESLKRKYDTENRGYSIQSLKEMRKLTDDELNRLEGLRLAIQTDRKSSTKFHSYTLPGGENYREVLLTLPSKGKESLPKGWKVQQDSAGSADAWRVYDEKGALTRFKGRTKDEAIQGVLSEKVGSSFKSTHWDEPNVLAHFRLNDRTDSAGRKTLFIEEVQSDWHQKGRKEGYKTGDRLIDGKDYQWWSNEADRLFGRAEYPDLAKRWEQAVANRDALSGKPDEVPNAPFKKSWHELALKRILRMAAEEGYDAVAWTTGEQQAERYDLSKQVSKIKYDVNQHGLVSLDVYDMRAINISDSLGLEERIPKKDVEKYIGKEAAKKIIESKESSGVLTGPDLKVGGEGMKGFYDQIIPAFLNKYTKKWGGRVEARDFSTSDMGRKKVSAQEALKAFNSGRTVYTRYADAWENITSASSIVDGYDYAVISPNSYNVHSLEITPAMRKAIMKGQPVYGNQGKLTGQEGFARIRKDDDWVKEQLDMFGSGKSYKKAVFGEGKNIKPQSEEALELQRLANEEKQGRLFGEVKNNEQKEESKKSIEAISDKQGNIKVVGPEGSTPVWESSFALHLKKTGSLSFPDRAISGPEDIAFAFQSLKNEVQEHLFLGAVKNGRVVAVEMVHLGAIDESMVSIYELQALLQGHGADGFFLVHNHPSGRIEASPEDRLITRKSSAALSQAGYEFKGHVIINDTHFGFIDPDHQYHALKHQEYEKTRDVSVFKKYGEWRDSKDAGVQVRDPESVYEVIKGIRKKSDQAIVFSLDKGNRIRGAVIIPKSSVNVSTLSRLATSARAKAIILADSGLDVLSLKKVVSSLGELQIKVLDSVDRRGEGYESKRELGAISEPEDLYRKQPENVRAAYGRKELERAINETNRDIQEIVQGEAEALESAGRSTLGGEIIQPDTDNELGKNQGKVWRTSLPDELKHPITGKKPSSKKQWRELALSNLEKGRSATNSHKEYAALKEQKNHFVERLVGQGMEEAQARLNAVEQLSKERPKPIEEMTEKEKKWFKRVLGQKNFDDASPAVEELSRREREWFNLAMDQAEIFDDVPPRDYDATKSQLGDINPHDLKDISGYSMILKDAYRNFEKVFGRHLPKVEKSLLRPLDEAVHEFVDFKKRLTEEMKSEIIDKLGIKKKSKLSAAVQMFGEGKFDPEDGRYYKMTDAELADMVGKENVEKVKAAERWFRAKYEMLIDRVNKVRAEIYPGNESKLVPKRQNYFRHFQEMSEISGIKNMFDTPANIPSELAGTSQFTQPKSKWASFMQRRLGNLTEIDAVGGFLDYIPAASQAIYVDPMIPKIRALEKHLRVITHESRNLNNFIEFLMQYANDLAGKTNLWDRGIQQVIGRKNMRVLDLVTRIAKKNAVLYNLSSALVQASNLPQAVAATKLYFPIGVGDYMKSIFVKGGPHEKSLFLSTRYGAGPLDIVNTGIMSKPEAASKWTLTLLDHVSTHISWYAFYDMAKGKGIEDPIRFADINTRKMVGGRAVHEVPLMQKAKVFQVLAPFTLEMQNLWWVLGGMKKEKDFVGIALFAMASWIMNNGFEVIIGRRVIFDPIEALISALSKDKDGKHKTIPQAIGRILGEISANTIGGNYVQGAYPEYGWTTPGGYKTPTRSQVFGSSDGTRYGSGVLAVQAVLEPQYSLLPSGGGKQIKKTLEGGKAINRGEVKVGNKNIGIKERPETTLRALAFGKSAIPEVRDYYKEMNEKSADKAGSKKSKNYFGRSSYFKSSKNYFKS